MPMLRVGSESSQPVEIYYEDHGSGKPIILIHGWPLRGRSWEAQLPALVGAGYRVITFDRRGFGWSSQPWSGYDYDTFADDLHKLIIHLDLRHATLVGFSMGGGEVARYIATQGTSRVEKAVLAAAVTPYLYKSADNPEGRSDDVKIEDTKAALRADRLAFLDTFATNFFSVNGKLAVSEMQRRYAIEIAAFASAKGSLDCVHAFSYTDFRGDLAKFALPTLVLHGDSDAIVPFEVSGARTLKAVQGSVSCIVKGAPHGFNCSHADAFNKGLLDFLAS
ncbi:MAG: alpha/beta hydrolase [Aeromicrobium sp.]|nr:alpha/beta hydrolase [Burkholderiales bacterium]